MHNELKELMSRVYKEKNINIYALVNYWEKLQKKRRVLYDIPESVYINVCKSILMNNSQILNHWAYFLKVLKVQSEKYFSEKHRLEGDSFKKQPANIFKIMREAMKGE